MILFNVTREDDETILDVLHIHFGPGLDRINPGTIAALRSRTVEFRVKIRYCDEEAAEFSSLVSEEGDWESDTDRSSTEDVDKITRAEVDGEGAHALDIYLNKLTSAMKSGRWELEFEMVDDDWSRL